MACAATISLGVPATTAVLSSRHFLRRLVAAPSSNLSFFPAALPAHFLIKLRGFRCPSAAAVFSATAGVGGAVLQDAGATALVVGGAYSLVSTFDNLTRRKIIEQENIFLRSIKLIR
ncbi:phytol kinase [Handroanthus impetiginosus]|uniref:Phytol kinase n=1 Tax=Handroanthus impetiginosus TaxID=429701 RepID=A0A2G9HP99_9LAMI|nr:phytol kinase [Handroanthus impetiginosus]